MESSLAPWLWHVVRAVLCMLRKGMARRKLAMDIHLLLQRGKIAGKTLGKLMTHHHHHHHHVGSSAATAAEAPPFSCRALNAKLAGYHPPRSAREVEFSCSNTPAYPSLGLNFSKRRRRRNRRRHDNNYGIEPGWYNYDAADIAKVFQILNNEQLFINDAADAPSSAVAATPSPALWSSFGRSPAPVRRLRITDSPFLVRDDEMPEDCAQVDRQAEEFIRRFYGHLRLQQSVWSATPEHGYSTYGFARPATCMA